jgi:hypothetical protein
MMTIQQTIDIPADRHLHFDVRLPEDFSGRKADITLVVKEQEKTSALRGHLPVISWIQKRQRQAKIKAIMDFAGCLKDSPTFEGDPVQIIRDMRDEWDIS